MIDILLLAVVAGVTFCTAQDGPWNAALTFVAVLLSGLFAMNFYEPLAMFLGSNVLTSYDWQHYWDVIALMAIFAGGVFGLRTLGERLMPTYAEVNTLVYEIGRWGLGALTGYTTMAILLTALHTAPLPREFIGFTPERQNFFMMAAPDRQWLAFTQYASEHALRVKNADGSVRVFDGAVFPANPSVNPPQMQVWSSFPIRYAYRRQTFYEGGAPAGGPRAPAAAPGAPANPTGSPVMPQSGGGSTPAF